MTARQGTLGIPEGPSEGADLALQPHARLLRDAWGHSRAGGSWGGPWLEALLIRVCRREPRGLHPISLGPLVLPRSAFLCLTVGNNIPGCRAEGGWRTSPHPGTWWEAVGRPLMLSTYWPGRESGRRSSSWFRTSFIFLPVAYTHWIL